jgi:beta-lactamase regulating signal transducer with metallopeptidase domain
MIAAVFEILFKSSLILIVTFIASYFAQRRSAAFRHWVWTAGLLSALISPILGMVLPAWHPQIATFAVDTVKNMNAAVSPATDASPTTAGSATGPVASAIPAEVRSNRPRVQWVLAIWILGAGLFSALLLVEILKLLRVAWHSEPVHNREWRDLAGDISSTLRLKRSVKLLWNSGSSVLGTWGTFRPRILLPREIENWSEERMRVVLAHELSHVKRNDWLLQMLAEAARVFYWFNPLFWLACARLRRESEFACDDAALRLGIDGPIYARHLLDVVRTLKHAGRPGAAALAMAGTSNLERRLVAMLNPSMDRRSVGKSTIAAIIALTLALTLPVAAMQAKGSVPGTAKTVLLATVAVQPAPPAAEIVETQTLVPEPTPTIPPTERETEEEVASEVIQEPAATPVQKVTSVAMVVALDTSGSMSQGQMTMAKEAAKAALKTLRDTDRFATLSFNTGFNWIVRLQAAANRDAMNALIDGMVAGGGTNIHVGLGAAYDALQNAKEDVKIVVLLSDGITQTADFQGLMGTMLNAGINVSTISVGINSNRALMADIAMWAKGRAYYINTYDRVPQVLVKEAELAISKTP